MRFFLFSTAGPVAVILLAPLPIGAQETQLPADAAGSLLEARTEVSLTPPRDPVSVKTTFLLRPGPLARQIPLSALVPEPAQLVSIQAVLNGTEIEVSSASSTGAPGEGENHTPPSGAQLGMRLERVRAHYWEGAIFLGEGVDAGADSLSLEISFMVEGAWSEEGTTTLPLVVPRWVPDPPTARTFLAWVSVPDGYTVTESFPTSVLARPAPGSAGVFEIGLQGVPAMLVLRTSVGSGPFLTLENGLDIFVVLILLAMGIAGLRYLRGRAA